VALLFSFPSLTTKLATYAPGRSAVKVGLAEVGSLRAALLPCGRPVSVHANWIESPFGSMLRLPSSVTPSNPRSRFEWVRHWQQVPH
jgi:hypothetical protein